MIRAIAAFFTASVFFGATACFAAPTADLVFVNGAVYTVDAARSWASALVVTGERITYVGDDATASTFVGPATRVVDLQHRMVLPGFQDSHVHPGMVPNPATSLDLHGLTRHDQILARIRQYADSHPDVPWIVGDGWDEVAFEPSRMPTREELDAVVADRPAFLTDNSGHDAWVNSRTLAAAGITAASADPPNGRIERDAHGRPTGLLHEDAAMDLVVPLIPPKSAAEQLADLKAALQEMTRLGFTALEDAMATPPIAAAFKKLDRQGALQQRVNLCLPFQPEKDDETQVRSFLKQRAALSGRWLRATCVKLFIDGAAAHTVALLQPYSDAPALGRGNLFIERARLNRLVTRLDAAGFQVHMHAQGDWAVRAGLDSFEEARRINGFRDNRHTIAHLWLVDPVDIPRFRSLSVIPNMTPVWSLGDTWETVDAPNMFGPDRSRHLFPTRSLLDAGAMLVWGSDWPVTGVSPLDGIETAITHRYPGGRDPFGIEDREWHPEERVSLERAIVAYTSTGAYLMHDEATRGTLAPGKRADLVVLHRNLFETEPLEIHQVPVDLTVFNGRIVFARAD
jgi:predicted amidohydrolase YtcJ